MHKTKRQRRIYRLRLTAQAVVAVAVIGMALIIGAARLAFPWILAHPEKVQAFLVERLKQPIRFARLDGNWQATGPIFTLHRVGIGDPAGLNAMQIDRAELEINFYAWMTKDLSFTEFRVTGVDIDLRRGRDGEWQVMHWKGGSGSVGESKKTPTLFNLAAVTLRAAKVRFVDEENGIERRLSRVDLRVLKSEGAHRLGALAWMDERGAPVRLVCAIRSAADLDCHAQGRQIELRPWLEKIPVRGLELLRGGADFRLWFGIRKKRFDGLRLIADLRQVALRGNAPIEISEELQIEPRSMLPDMRLDVGWRRRPNGWQLDWLTFGDERDRSQDQHLRVLADAAGYRVYADRLQAKHIAMLSGMLAEAPKKLRRFLFESGFDAVLRDLRLELDQDRRHWRAEAHLENMGWARGTKTPGLTGLSGRLLADEGAILLLPRGDKPLVLDYPYVFRDRITMQWRRGIIGAWREEAGWHLALGDFALGHSLFAVEGRADLAFVGEGRLPFLSAEIGFGKSDVAGAKLFWPLNTMPAKTMAWLDHALADGAALSGQAVVFGDLDQWPFKDFSGRFEARAEVRDLLLDYHPEWPKAQIKKLDVAFVAGGMDVVVEDAEILQNRISSATARIERLKEPVLDLKVAAKNDGNALLGLLRQSPLNAKLGSNLAGLSMDGPVELAFDLHLPLKQALGTTTLNGTGKLLDARIRSGQWRLDFEKANGDIRFGKNGFEMVDIPLLWGGDPAKLSLAIGDYASRPERAVEATLVGQFPMQQVFRGVKTVEPWLQQASGKADWRIGLVSEKTETRPAATRLTATSTLRGIALELPAPLRKDAASELPMSIDIALPFAGAGMEMRLGNLLRMKGMLPGESGSFKGALAFGVAELGEVPDSGLRIRGDVPALDISGWMAFAGAPGGSDLALDIDVGASELLFLSRAIPDERIRYETMGNSRLVTLRGKDLQGTVHLPAQDTGLGITVELERLHLPEIALENLQLKPRAEAENAVMPAPPARKTSSFDPSKVPMLHVWIKEMQMGTANLGEMHVETFPVENGMRIARLETKAKDLAIRAEGEWLRTSDGERSIFDISFSSGDLGKMLGTLGYAGFIEGGSTKASIEGAWVGSPGEFALSKIDGSLSAEVGAGRILNVDPGAGRLLGLVSLQALPRRLALDFSDFFDSGMSFDTIKGRFELRDGNAYTDSLEVKGPVADVKVKGRTGLAQKDYDQEMEVSPKVGGVFPVVGALAGGPIGAAAGLLVQGVFNNQIGQMVKARYAVKGSWEKPDIQLISKERVKK